MATNGNRWLKERGGKNPLARQLQKKGKNGTLIEVTAGAAWVHKVTGLRFMVEDVDDEIALLAPEDPNGAPVEMDLAQFREQFEPASK